MTINDAPKKLDAFTRAYITTALWSSTEYKFGTCPCCGNRALLDRYPEEEFTEEPMCSAAGCGTREIPNPEPMDANYSERDLAPDTRRKMIADCAKFQASNADTISAAIATGEVKCGPDFDEYGRAGHDFWLTRCSHGAGFFDGDWPEPFATRLTEAAKAFGNCDLYAGDSGEIFVS